MNAEKMNAEKPKASPLQQRKDVLVHLLRVVKNVFRHAMDDEAFRSLPTQQQIEESLDAVAAAEGTADGLSPARTVDAGTTGEDATSEQQQQHRNSSTTEQQQQQPQQHVDPHNDDTTPQKSASPSQASSPALSQQQRPSPSHPAASSRNPLTRDILASMTGAERRAVLRGCPAIQAQHDIYFVRAMQHITVIHETLMLDSPDVLTHRVRSAKHWVHFSNTEEGTLLGQGYCIPSERPQQRQDSSSGLRGIASTEEVSSQLQEKDKNLITSSVINDSSSANNNDTLQEAAGAAVAAERTGPLGIKNQGSTCYLNSLLQCLFNLTTFRYAIYDMPTADEPDAKKAIPLALQKLFYHLETAATAASTTELTASFGWTSADSFVQHDIHELTRILLDNLEEKMKKTEQHNIVKDLFGGSLENFCEVAEVNYRSTVEEPIYDIQLVVKQCKSVYESLDQFFEVTVLDGTNKYCLEREGHEKSYHRAERGVKFKKAPSVLLLHLNRFDFDLERCEMKKVTTRWEYYDTIDLSKYLPNLPKEETQYKLHSVLVHSGSEARFGHYFSCVMVDGKWMKFNDDEVTCVGRSDVFGKNFGGTTTGYWGTEIPKTTDAYMLAYVCASKLKEVLSPETRVIQQHLIDRIAADAEAAEQVKKERSEEHLHARINILTINDLVENPGLLVCTFPYRLHLKPEKCVRALKTATLESVSDKITEITGIEPENQQYWIPGNQVSLSDVSDTPSAASMSYQSYSMSMHMSKESLAKDTCLSRDYRTMRESILLVLDKTQLLYEGGSGKDGSKCPSTTNSSASRTFAITHHKIFCAGADDSSLVYAGPIMLCSNIASHVRVLEDKVRSLIMTAPFAGEVSKSDTLSYAVEKDDGTLQIMPSPCIESGRIYVWYKDLSDAEAKEFPYPTVESYKHFVDRKLTVNIHLNDHREYPFVCTLFFPDDASYEFIQKALARHLDIKKEDFDYIRVSRHNNETRSPFFTKPKKYDAKPMLLRHMLQTNTAFNDILYYEIGEYTVEQIESSNPMSFAVYNKNMAKLRRFNILLPKNDVLTVNEMIQACLKSAGPEMLRMAGTAETLSVSRRDTTGGFSPSSACSPSMSKRDSMDAEDEAAEGGNDEEEDEGKEKSGGDNKDEKRLTNGETHSNSGSATTTPAVSTPSSPLRTTTNLTLEDFNSEDFCVVDVWRGKIFNLYLPSDTVMDKVEENAEYRLEQVPKKDPSVPSNKQTLLHIHHFYTTKSMQQGLAVTQQTTHSDPIVLYVPHDEKKDAFMLRVAAKLGKDLVVIQDWKVTVNTPSASNDIPEDQSVVDCYNYHCRSKTVKDYAYNFFIGLEHAPTTKKTQVNKRRDERSLKIFN